MPEPHLIAADTNVLLDYAEQDETAIDCFDILRQRLPGSSVLVLPTVLHELADLADDGETERIRRASRAALGQLLHPWHFRPINCVPVAHGIVERIAQMLRDKGLIPSDQMNDSLVVAEASLLNVSLLLSSDQHLKELPQDQLRLVMDAADVRTPLLASPWKIVHTFFR